MIVSHALRCIFVHVQKTAGSSVEAVLRQNDPSIGSHFHQGRRHAHARELRDGLDATVWDGYFKFAFVRNPWDRLVSWYQMCQQDTAPNAFSRYVRNGFPTFASFVAGATTGPGAKTIVNQIDYLTDAGGQAIVDFVGRYESLDADFAQVCERIGIAGPLPRANASRRGDYRGYYDEMTRDVVAGRFRRDIDAFGYQF